MRAGVRTEGIAPVPDNAPQAADDVFHHDGIHRRLGDAARGAGRPALADKFDAGEAVSVQAVRVMDVLGAEAGFDAVCRPKYFGMVGAPAWLVELACQRPSWVSESRVEWPGVEISADDTVRRTDDPARW